ncbi:hypothetical protein HYS91_05395 [Candidatus Daviesbacteria bacterium]|nr:hypothetical protein [Candidatus Daviesbacteria bacterium]
MKVKSISWLGVRTNKFNEMCKFYEEVFKLPKVFSEPGFAAYKFPNGDLIEIFAESYESHKLFNTGPVPGFEVENIEQAREEMEKLGIEFIGPIEEDKDNGNKWSHFRHLDGNIYELSQRGKS